MECGAWLDCLGVAQRPAGHRLEERAEQGEGGEGGLGGSIIAQGWYQMNQKGDDQYLAMKHTTFTQVLMTSFVGSPTHLFYGDCYQNLLIWIIFKDVVSL